MTFRELKNKAKDYPLFKVEDVFKWFPKAKRQTTLNQLNSWVKKGYLENIRRSVYKLSDFNIKDARQDLIETIDNYLSAYVERGRDKIEKFEILNREIRSHFLLNLFFYFQLRKKFKPRPLNLLLHFRVSELYLALLYFEENNYKKVEKILRHYFKRAHSSDLFDLIRLCPKPSTIEIT